MQRSHDRYREGQCASVEGFDPVPFRLETQLARAPLFHVFSIYLFSPSPSFIFVREASKTLRRRNPPKLPRHLVKCVWSPSPSLDELENRNELHTTVTKYKIWRASSGRYFYLPKLLLPISSQILIKKIVIFVEFSLFSFILNFSLFLTPPSTTFPSGKNIESL